MATKQQVLEAIETVPVNRLDEIVSLIEELKREEGIESVEAVLKSLNLKFQL
jgi:hypothetical protein